MSPASVLCLATVGIFAALIALTVGWLPPVMISPGRVWLLFPITQIYMYLAYRGLGDLIGEAAPSEEANTFRTIHLAMFGVSLALLAQALLFVVVCKLGPHRKLVQILYPPTAVYCATCSYYGYKSFGEPMATPMNVHGYVSHPFHHVLWMCSTSVQCVLWTQLHHIECEGTSRGSFALPAKMILLALTMLWTGMLGDMKFDGYGILPNVVLMVAATVTFYMLLATGTSPLQRCVEFYEAKARTINAGSAREGSSQIEHYRLLQNQFRMAKAYIWYSWHSFPLVWALGAMGLVGSDWRERLFVLSDILAKFLPVSLYVSLLSVR